MRFRKWWSSLSFFWQVYLFTVVAISGIITFVELVLEAFVEEYLLDTNPMETDWHEAVIWFASIVIPSILFGFALIRMVMRKLNGLDEVTKRLARGDLNARVRELGNTGDVFNRLGSSFNIMADSLQSQLTNEKRLLAAISHELRSPLTRMSVSAELITKKCGDPSLTKLTASLEGEVRQMSDLVAALLEQGRIRGGDLGKMAPIDFSRLAEEVIAATELSVLDTGKSVSAAIEPRLIVYGFPVRVRMVLDNILANALFYAPVGSSVDFAAFRKGDFVTMRVRDYGPGVPEKHLTDIFRPFFRIDDSRSRGSGGVGLGLVLVKESILAMDGEITARNAAPGLEVIATMPYHE